MRTDPLDISGAGGGKGGGSSSNFTQTPDNLRSEDVFEGLLGLGQGPWVGPRKGLESIRIEGTPLEDSNGSINFPGWVAAFASGDPTAFPQKPALRLGNASSPVTINVPLSNTVGPGSGTPVVRTVSNISPDAIDLRFVVTQLFYQDEDGVFNNTMNIKIRMKPTGHSTWIEVLIDTTATEPDYSKGGKLIGTIQTFVSKSYYDSNGDRTDLGSVSGQLTIQGKTTQPYVKEVRVGVPSTGAYAGVSWDIECTLVEKDSVDTDPVFEKREVSWESAAAVYKDDLGADLEWLGLAWMSVYGDASDRISGVPEIWTEFDTKIINVPPTSVYDPTSRFYTGATWDGSWVKSYTRDPAWVMTDMIADPNAGVSSIAPGSFLNKWDALELSKHCSELVPDGDTGQIYFIANITTVPKANVRVAMNTNVTISSPGATLDGVTMAATNRVLLYGQTAPAQNGIYVWNGAASAMTRATDNDTAGEMLGAACYCTEGSRAERWFKQCQTITTLGTTAVRFVPVHNRYQMDYTLDQPMKADELIKNIAGAVGAVAWDNGGGEWRCKSERAETPLAVFTEQNIEGEFVYTHTDIDTRYNDISVVFKNAEFDYREDRVRVYDQTDIDEQGRKAIGIVALGCTNRQEAVRRGMLRLRASINEFRVVTFTTNRQARYLERLGTILVADQSLGYTAPSGSTPLANTDEWDRTTGRILSLDGPRTTITLRDPMRLEPGATYSIKVTVPNPNYAPLPAITPTHPDWDKPTVVQSYAVTGGSPRGDVTTINLSSALPANVPLNAPIALDATGLPTLPKTYRITDLKMDDEGERVVITAIEVDTGKQAAADNADASLISAQVASPTTPPPVVPLGGVLNLLTYQSLYGTQKVLEIDWEKPNSKFVAGFEVWYSFNNSPLTYLTTTTGTRAEIPNPQFGIYTASIRTIDRRGQKSVPLTATLQIVEAPVYAAYGYLTNEVHTVPVDSAGVVTSYSGAGGTFKVLIGTKDVTADCTFAITSNPQTLTASIANGTGVYSVTAGLDAAEDSASLTFTATHTATGNIVTKTFTLAKTFGPRISLSATAQSFKFVDNVANPGGQSITFTATKTNTTETINWTSDVGVTLTGSGDSRTLSVANFGANREVVITATGATSGEYDTFTVIRLDVSTAEGGANTLGDGNRVRYSLLEAGFQGWGTLTESTPLAEVLTVDTSADARRYLKAVIPFSANSQTLSIGSTGFTNFGTRIPVEPGERLSVQARIGFTAGNALRGYTLNIHYATAAGASLSTTNIGSGVNTVAIDTLVRAFVTVPATARFAWIELFANANTGGGSGGSSSLWLGECYVGSVGANQTTHPPFVPGPSNEYGADVTSIVDGPSSSTFLYDYTGITPEAGQFSRDLSYRLMTAVGFVASGVTWTYLVKTGTVNGFTSASGVKSMTGSGAGIFTVASLGSSTAEVEIKATYNGVARTLLILLTKQLAAAPVGGGGSGSTIVSKSSGFTSISSTSFVDITGTQTGAMPSGKTAATLGISLNATPAGSANGTWTVEMKFQRFIGGSWTDKGVTQSAGSSWQHVFDPEEFVIDPAAFNYTFSDTGLTGGTSYDWRVVARLTSGTRSHAITGSFTVVVP